MRARIRSFLRGPSGRDGNVAIFFAFSLLPMLGLIGLGIDAARQISAQTILAAAADAAALAAATQTKAALDAAGGNTSAAFSAAQTVGQQAGQNVFAANAAKVGAATVGTPTITVSQQGQAIVATAKFSGSLPTAFGKIFGLASLALNGTASASLKMPVYINISAAFDVSQSMGLGATQQDITNLQAATVNTVNGSCAFGCHETSPGDYRSNEQAARANNITLRIDVIKSATQNMITTAQNLGTNRISFSLYTLQEGSPNPGALFTTLATSSTNYSSLYSTAGTIDLGRNDGNVGYGDTDLSNSLPALARAVGTSGNGQSSSSPVQYVFLMTDGVVDTTSGSCPGTHCVSTINPQWCQSMKNNGVTIGVIYTTYLAMPNDGRYNLWIAPIANNIAPSLQSCASPGWFYQAFDKTDIQNAINALFTQAVNNSGVLTQ